MININTTISYGFSNNGTFNNNVTITTEISSGVQGLSAYETWLSLGNTGTEQDFIDSLKGADGAQGPQGEQGVQGETGPQGPADLNEAFLFAASDESSNLTIGANKITGHWPYDFVLTSVFIGVSVAPTGSSLIINFKDKTGTTIFSVAPTISAGEYTSLTNITQPVFSINSFTRGDKWTLDIDQVGFTIPGKGLKIYFIGTKS